jgi:branched-chain amino acid transport system permease protein
MGNLSIQDTNEQPKIRKIYYFLTIIVTEIIIFTAFINFLLSQSVDYKIILILLPVILFFVLRKNQKIVNLTREAFNKHKLFAIILGILLLAYVPFVFKSNTYLLHICIISGIYLIIAQGLNIQLGSTGLVNFAFAAFFGVGAYTSAILAVNYHYSFWIGILAAALISSLFSLLVGSLTLKSTGFYYALVTMAFQIIFHLLVNNLKFTGGSGGISRIPFPEIGKYSFMFPLKIFGVTLPFQANFYYLVLIIAILSIYLVNQLYKSRTGLVWNAIREDEIAAKCQGINVAKGKLEASAIGAIFGGVAGAIYAHYITYISPESFTFQFSVVLISMVILGGADSIAGVALGAIILTIIPEKIRFFAEARMLLYGIIIIAVLIFKPKGIIPETIRKYNYKSI